MSILKKLFGIAEEFERNSLNEIVVLLHKEARHHTPHGFITVTNRGLGIKNAPVAFVFPDFPEAPPLTLRLVTDLWEALRAQGYIPHELASYGGLTAVPAEEHASEDAGFVMSSYDILAARHGNTDQMARVMKMNPARHGMHIVQPGVPAQGTLIDPTLKSFTDRVAHFDEDGREVASIRFDQIMRNGLARSESLEDIKLRLESALQQMLEDFEARTQRTSAMLGRWSGAASTDGATL